ncbi:TrmB family transcriptional regulator [Natronoarchaeum rubrum]|uniref:TrmB family transcriptional regulator n=1 Tax=Natronoarchaeum rubrum TaxID=755311 RepID=UPI002111B637|nr:helix-turn-helix domain-containing protein [Natronoarchaeum rubrum]
MKDISSHEQSVELLQQLGLKEYEAKSFVALSRLPKATAKDISDVSDVPRTRVYDAIRVLEAKGLVEIQHSNPQQYRAVKIDEAAATLREEFESRTEKLADSLSAIDAVSLEDEDEEVSHEVWSLSGSAAIRNRTKSLFEDADEEIVLVLGDERKLTDDLFDQLRAARDRGTTVLVGTVSETLRDRVNEAMPEVEVFVSELEWLSELEEDPTDTVSISQLLLVDRSAILVSTTQQANVRGEQRRKPCSARASRTASS